MIQRSLEFGADFAGEARGQLFEGEDTVEPSPAGRPLFQLPFVTQAGDDFIAVRGDMGRPEVVRFDRAFEVQAQLSATARDHGLEFEVDLRVAVVELQHRPLDVALRPRKGGWKRRHREVFAGENPLAGLERPISRRHAVSVVVPCFNRLTPHPPRLKS